MILTLHILMSNSIMVPDIFSIGIYNEGIYYSSLKRSIGEKMFLQSKIFLPMCAIIHLHCELFLFISGKHLE